MTVDYSRFTKQVYYLAYAWDIAAKHEIERDGKEYSDLYSKSYAKIFAEQE